MKQEAGQMTRRLQYTINTSMNVVNAGNKLWSSVTHVRSSKATEIRKMSQNSALNILPEPYDEELPFIRSPLMDIIL
jgi:hypothetical protein